MQRLSPLAIRVGERTVLERWSRSRTTPHRLVMRSRIILALADGKSGRETAALMGISRHTVDLWRTRFRTGGCPSLVNDQPGRGRKPAPRVAD